jgi:hypothetical protein
LKPPSRPHTAATTLCDRSARERDHGKQFAAIDGERVQLFTHQCVERNSAGRVQAVFGRIGREFAHEERAASRLCCKRERDHLRIGRVREQTECQLRGLRHSQRAHADLDDRCGRPVVLQYTAQRGHQRTARRVVTAIRAHQQKPRRIGQSE